MTVIHEQRKEARTATSVDTIYFTVERNPEDQIPQRMHYPGLIINISEGGIGLLANYPHQPDEHLWFEGLSRHKSLTSGIVRWIKDHHQQYTIGIQFIEASGMI